MKVMGRKSCRTQRSNGRSGTRQWNHGEPSGLYSSDKGITRVRYKRRARITDERNRLTGGHPVGQLLYNTVFAVLVKTHKRRGNIVVRHERSGVTSVLRRNQIDRLECFKRSECYVANIPNRCRHNV